MKKYVIFSVLATLTLLLAGVVSADSDKKAYCHANNGTSGYTYHFNSAWDQHFRNNGSTLGGHELDFYTSTDNENCTTTTPTPTPTPTTTATSRCSSTPTPSPTSTPTPTSTPQATQTPVATEAPNNDICANIDGVQTSLPEGSHKDASGKNCVWFGVPGVPQSSGSGIGGGQVLGASTMAGTGVVEDAIFNSIFALGSLLTSFGIIKKSAKSKEHSS